MKVIFGILLGMVIIFSFSIVNADDLLIGCVQGISTNIFVREQAGIDYGLVGVDTISSTITSPDKMQKSYIRIFEYDVNGNIARAELTLRQYALRNGRWETTFSDTMPYDPHYSDIKASNLGRGQRYEANIITPYWGNNSSTYLVSIRVTEIGNNGQPIPDRVISKQTYNYNLSYQKVN